MKHKTGRKLLSFLLTLAMLVGLMPGMSLTAYAATDTYTALMNNATVVKFNGYDCTSLRTILPVLRKVQ